MKNLILLLFALGLFACKKEEQDPQPRIWGPIDYITYHSVEVSALPIIADTFWVKSNSLDDAIGYIDHGYFLTSTLPVIIDLSDRVLKPSHYFSLEFYRCKPVTFIDCIANTYLTIPDVEFEFVPEPWLIDEPAFKLEFDVTFKLK